MAAAVIEARGLTKSYGPVRAVRGLDLLVDQGSVHGLLGPNGSGKSTTVRMLLALVRPDAGEILLFGQPLRGDPSTLLRRVGSLVETPAFVPYLSGRDNLSLLETYRGRAPGSRIERSLHRVNLHADAQRRFKDYSFGMKQRLGIAAALLDDPELIILDEPTNGLDPAGTREVRALIPALAGEGHTVVLCSHLLHEVEQVCDTVSILNRGQVVRSGRTRDLIAGSTRLEIEVADVEQAYVVLRASPWADRVTRDGGLLVVEGAGAAGAEINRLLSSRGVFAGALRPVRQNLEDVFMEATEEPAHA